MRRRTALPLLLIPCLLGTVQLRAEPPRELRPFIEKHCADCHDSESAKGGLDFGKLSADLNQPEALASVLKAGDNYRLRDVLILATALAVGSYLAFIVLLVREKVACWAFGISGSLLSVYLFADARLYSEAILYFFYAVMGLWGWARWRHVPEVRPCSVAPCA